MKYCDDYKVIAEYNQATNDYPRMTEGSHKGEIDPSFDDLYIKCKSGNKIYHSGGNVLTGYIPSLGRGHNILKLMYDDLIGSCDEYTTTIKYKDKNDIEKERSIFDYEKIKKSLEENGLIFNIEETDSELLFKFKANNIKQLEKYMNPVVNKGKKPSRPFSKSNLPHSKKYIIPLEDLALYKEITALIPKCELSFYSKINNDFIAKLSTKKHTIDDIKSDMKLQGLLGKFYFHSIGKWNEYCDFTKKCVDAKYNK